MKTKKQKSSRGNWITFLSGALFNVLAHMALNNAIHYSLHALVGGIVFLFFKILLDPVTPGITSKCRSMWKDVTNRIRNSIFVNAGDGRASKYPERGKTPRA
jgi:hypothetical protein